MSEIQKNEIPLIQIAAPELNQSGYAEELSKTFENIDTNFATLANYDFIKGESGNSVVINAMPFFDENGNINDYGQKVKQYFETSFEESVRKSIRDLDGNEIALFDNFTPEKAGYLYLISEFDNNVEEVSEPVTSLYYVFLDGRFANNKIGQINESDFSSIEDLSCILVYDKYIDGFKALENAFPTIYYEDKSGLCWKVNGSETGIPVKGQPGDNGKDAIFQFVECSAPTDSNSNEYRQAVVTHVYQYPEHIDIADCDINDLNGGAAMILIKQADKQHIYFGQLKIKDGILYAIYYENLEITKIKHTTDFINVLKSINFASADFNNLPGLFIPMDIESNTGISMVQPAHLLTATSITNTRGDSTNSKNADLLLTGVHNINGVSALSKEKLLVEKYLYVLANKNADLFTSNNQYIINSIKNLDKHGYVLKYKLSSIIYDYNVLKSFEKFAKDEYTHAKYFNTEVGGQNHDSAKDTIPDNFSNRLDNNNSLGVYCWELCNVNNDFDKDIIPFKNIENVSYDDNVKNYFGNIFTDTINPNGSSYFMWFNGIENISANESNAILYGWGDDESQRPPLFSFKQFVPIFVNDFKSNIDTALNVNYNVNITGDNDDSKRNITVNGALNSNNINTQQLYADEIKNIYTNDIITGNNGLQLGKKPSSGYYTTIDEFGNMNLQGVADVGRIKCQKSLTAVSMSASSVTSKNLNVSLGLTDFVKITPTSDVIPMTEFNPEQGGGATSRSGETNTTSNSNTSIDLDYALNVEFNDVENMSIKAAEGHKSKIDSTVPFIASENAGIIVSNVDSESDNVLFYYGATTNDNTVKNAYTFNKNKVKQNASKNQTAGRNYKYNGSIKSTSDLLQENNLMFINGDNGNKHEMQQPTKPDEDTRWKTYTMHSTAISNNSGDINYTFNNNKPITINFGYYMFIIDLYAEGAALDKNFPRLSADSYIKLHTFYKIDNNETEITSLTQELHFNEEHCNERYIGVNRDGHVNTSNGNGAECDRYQGYVIHPDSIVIKDKNILTTIKNAYDNKKTIEIIVRPEVFIKFTSDKKKLINLKVSQLVPINTKYLYSGGQTTQINSNVIQEVYNFENAAKKYAFSEDNTEHPLAWKWPNTVEIVPGSSMSFTVIATVMSADIHNTTVCQDGIVIRSGNIIFGIGDIDDNGPSLFLYEHGQTNPLKSKLLKDLLK